MKKLIKNAALIVLLVALAMLVPGCATTTTSLTSMENDGRFLEIASLPVKDFESRGLVFIEVQLVTTIPRVAMGSIIKVDGEMFTYHALLQEARKAGGDAIINIVIDKKTENIVSASETKMTETWYGSALAIRYTTALTTQHQTQSNTRGVAEKKSIVSRTPGMPSPPRANPRRR